MNPFALKILRKCSILASRSSFLERPKAIFQAAGHYRQIGARRWSSKKGLLPRETSPRREGLSSSKSEAFLRSGQAWGPDTTEGVGIALYPECLWVSRTKGAKRVELQESVLTVDVVPRTKVAFRSITLQARSDDSAL